MTFSARFAVAEIQHSPKGDDDKRTGPIIVVAVAEGAAVTSNTEGPITRMELRASIDADSVTLKPGDEFHASGHFDA